MSRKKKKSSAQWRNKQSSDGFVREANRIGARSRSFFKIEEIDRKFGLFKSGCVVLDLGSSPGGWAQYSVTRVGQKGSVFAVDLLPMEPIPGVEFRQFDISLEQSMNGLLSLLGGKKVNILLSDMAPNITGNALIDSANYSHIYEAIFGVCDRVMATDGTLVFKFFQNSDSVELKMLCQTRFGKCKVHKPKSSRQRSQESYMVAARYKGHDE